MMEKQFPDPFLKSQNWAYLWINILKFYTVCFGACRVEGYRNILKLSCRPLAFTSYKAFLESKTRSGAKISLSHFLHDFFFKKCFSCQNY